MAEPKGLAGIFPPSSSEDDGDDGGEASYEAAKQSAADDVLAAINEGNVEALKTALTDFIDLCTGK